MIERFRRRLDFPDAPPTNFREFLRYEFRFRCCYCGTHEAELPDPKAFEIDHFRPQYKFKAHAKRYSNLYYSCLTCNRYKHRYFPTPEEIEAGAGLVDPCLAKEDWDSSSGHEEHFTLLASGHLEPLTPAGQTSILRLRLNRKSLVKRRVAKQRAREKLLRTIRRLDGIHRTVQEAAQLAEKGGREDVASELSVAEEQTRDSMLELLEDWRPVKRPYDE